MTLEEAEVETVKIFGEDSFAETDGDGRFYVGRLPTVEGKYTGYMGSSWERALAGAKGNLKLPRTVGSITD